MPFIQSCKSAACGVISCCDRQAESKAKTQYASDGFSHVGFAPSKRSFNRLRSWPNSLNTQRPRWVGGGRKTTISSRQEHEDDLTDKSYDIAFDDITQKIFTYDIQLFGTERDKVAFRRLLLDFQVKINAISGEIPRLLNLPISPYNGPEVRLPNGKSVMPHGTLEVEWKLYKGKRQYKTKFLVIENNHFDMLLGRPSIKKYKLSKEDKDIQRRLQYRC